MGRRGFLQTWRFGFLKRLTPTRTFGSCFRHTTTCGSRRRESAPESSRSLRVRRRSRIEALLLRVLARSELQPALFPFVAGEYARTNLNEAGHHVENGDAVPGAAFPGAE